MRDFLDPSWFLRSPRRFAMQYPPRGLYIWELQILLNVYVSLNKCVIVYLGIVFRWPYPQLPLAVTPSVNKAFVVYLFPPFATWLRGGDYSSLYPSAIRSSVSSKLGMVHYFRFGCLFIINRSSLDLSSCPTPNTLVVINPA